MTSPTITTDPGEWHAAARELLVAEKAATRQRDELAARRRQLPWLRLDTDYALIGTDGPLRLSELFGANPQLVVYHFMFGRDWEEGCPTCSFWADSFDGTQQHLAARNTSFACVSSAPIGTLSAYQRRMGWGFTWVSAGDSGFNHDLGVSHTPEELESGAPLYNHGTGHPMGPESAGLSAFLRDEDGMYLTYQTFARGLEVINAAYNIMDLTALGRDEDALPYPMAWIRRHDDYAE